MKTLPSMNFTSYFKILRLMRSNNNYKTACLMKRTCNMNTESDPHLTKKVALVERNPKPFEHSLISTIAVGKSAPNDLVELAIEIQKSNNFIHANACNKLQTIAEQIRFLQKQAEAVLKETKTNLDLHNAACNFVKVPGNIYHLYKKPLGQIYFSMLAFEEWTSCPHKYLGSYRLELDHSWTPINDIDRRDAELSLVNKILNKKDQPNLCLTSDSDAMDI